MYLLIILMPLLSSILAGFFGRKIGVTGAQIMSCSLIITTTILAITAFTEIEANGSPISIYLFKWIDLESINVYFGFNFDSLTTLMLIPVLFVSSLVHVYSIGYMSHDPHNQRFFSYLSLFTFMMIILVTANNYLLMFVGWEGVGICSYLLVSFWFTRIAANQSSIAAILTNRVGDCFLTIGMFAIIWSLGNLDYATIFSLSPFINENIITIIGICLLIGAMAKSSQIGLHVWLPMAMEGPTPVSALIHAATMVTAGVYLLIRSSPLIEYSTTVLLLCLWIGAITSLISSLIGLFQQDIKKVIAYSTMSQLGIMVVAIGLSSYSIALFHLVNHAFYKALLFLGAGSVIHAVADKQDFRKYGGLKKFLPLSHSVMLIASLSLIAFPFMTGYFSKDSIIESCYGKYDFSTITVYYIVVIGAMFTTLYSVKTLYLTFETNPNGSLRDNKSIHEGNLYMSMPLVVLALFSIYFGFITRDMFIGLGSDFFVDNSIFIQPGNEIMINTEFAVPTLYKLLPFILTVLLIIISFIISEYFLKTLMWFKFTTIGYNLFSFLNLRFLIELIYNRYITENILKSGEHTSRILDKGAIELVGPYGLENTTLFLSRNLSSLDTGVVTTYAVYILIGGLTYLYIPYTSLLPIPIFVVLFFIFINKSIYNFSIDLSIKVPLKTNLQSGLDYMYIIKRIIRVTLIAIVLWCIRYIVILVFELHREDLIDCITIANISTIFSIVIETIWPTGMYQGVDTSRSIKCDEKLRKSTLLLSSEDSSRSSSISSGSVRSETSNPASVQEMRNAPVYPATESTFVTQALQQVGRLITGDVIRTETNIPSTFNVPYIDTGEGSVWDNPPHAVDKVFSPTNDCIGRVVTEYRNEEILKETWIVLAPDPQSNDITPFHIGRYYDSQAFVILSKPFELTDINSPDPEVQQSAHVWRYRAAYYSAKADEAWGIYDSGAHRTVAEYRRMDPNMNIYIPPSPSPFFPAGTYYPGTEPANNSPTLNAIQAANSSPTLNAVQSANSSPTLNAVQAANNILNNNDNPGNNA